MIKCGLSARELFLARNFEIVARKLNFPASPDNKAVTSLAIENIEMKGI